jgi:prepilin-type N-terminal cleavage/methylation domain-containing protein
MKGFTLIEILIAMAIFVFLTAISLSLTYTSKEAWYSSATSIGLRQEIMKTLMTMEKELKQTRPSKTDLAIGANSTSISFKVPKNTNGTVLDASGNIVWSDTITYSLNSGQIRRNDSATTTVLSNNITSLLFIRPASAANLLQVNIGAQKTTTSQRVFQDTEQMMIKMRN